MGGCSRHGDRRQRGCVERHLAGVRSQRALHEQQGDDEQAGNAPVPKTNRHPLRL